MALQPIGIRASATGILQSVTFDGVTVRVKRLFTSTVIPLDQVAAVERDPAAASLTIITTGGRLHTIKVFGGGKFVQEAVLAAKALS
jgi:hypothetical protein